MRKSARSVLRFLGVGVAVYHASRLINAARRIARSLACACRNPRWCAKSFSNMPSVLRGARFSSGPGFLPPGQFKGGVPESADPLLSYFEAHLQGPGIWKWIHYFEIYHRHFKKFVGREVHVLEVGIYGGGSLAMWREYFGEGCRVYGVDIEEACMAYKNERTEVFIGDQADRSFWAEVRMAAPRIDILIDDGGHTPEQQRVTLEEMLPHIRPGGVYLCEDVLGDSNEFAAFAQGLAAGLNSATTPVPMPDGMDGAAFAASGFQGAIGSVHLYPWVVVVEKRDHPCTTFVSLKHGSNWQPFL